MNDTYAPRREMFNKVHNAVLGKPSSIVEDAKRRGLLPSVVVEGGNYTGMEESDFIGPIHPEAADTFIASLR